MRSSIIPLACLCSVIWSDVAAEPNRVVDLDPFVITSVREQTPLTLDIDARATVQPMPAQDGADFLKHVPGFSVIRKGGTDGDPVLRGLAGSRLSVLIEGECLLGGCGQRMDPPTAYVFPSSYDRVFVMKGPQTVRYGPGNSAGTVRFERETPSFSESSRSGQFFLTCGSFGRYDGGIEGIAGNEFLFGRIYSNYSESDDYDNGFGDAVHSHYHRWSVGASTGWTPNRSTLLELSVNTGDGEAAYADRMMDGVKFERRNIGLRFRRDSLSDTLERLEMRIYYNSIDHVMDNFSLRTFTANMMMPNPTVSNPDRLTWGGKALVNLSWGGAVEGVLGVDFQFNDHAIRKTSNETTMPYREKDRADDGRFRQEGIFSELSFGEVETGKVIVGSRLDLWQAEDQRPAIALGMMGSMPNPTALADRNETFASGFARYERDMVSGWGRVYAGIGHVSRFPDYWELFSKEMIDGLSAFETDFEKTTQIDVGWLFDRERWSASVSLFSARHEDFILIESNVVKPMGTGTRLATISRSVDATTVGGECSVSYQFRNGWYGSGSVAYVRGENETDDLPLAQIPPLEGRLEAGYRNARWSLGCLLRMVDEQDRVAVNQGSIVGQDLGPSPSFEVFSLHAGWRIRDGMNIAAGIDNLFDRAYADHISRAGSGVSGYLQTSRIYEPGRTLWVRMSASF